jgi:glycosyltransferase involved in cell wall biosynthesis
MSCGLPVISTKCGGPESIIINKKLGILVNNNNLEELATGMYTLYKNKYDSDYIRKYCVENFSEEVISQKLKKVYQEVIKKENI